MTLDDEAMSIVSKMKEYGVNAFVSDIERYINSNQTIVVYEDFELIKLKRELEGLDELLQTLIDEKNQYLSLII